MPEGGVVVTLDPGLAFGTGKHETTRACLEYIDEIAGDSAASAGAAGAQAPAPQARRHLAPSFLDMGCGSGILSIAAAKLGFSPVAGFDIDEDAVGASRENAALNGVDVDYALFALGKGSLTLDESIEAAKGLYPDLQLNLSQRSQPPGTSASQPPRPFAPSDVVVANILGPLLISFAGEIASYARKTLIVSGILSDLYPEVLAAFESRGFGEVSRKTIGEWTTGHLVRRGGVRG
jgi:ribosomal protein L11 methyltransferase